MKLYLLLLFLSSILESLQGFIPTPGDRGRNSPSGTFFLEQLFASHRKGFRTRATNPSGEFGSARDEASTTTTESSSPTAFASAASVFTGAGPAQVDMNQYNLAEWEQIVQEWTAVVVPRTALKEAGIYLAAKNRNSILVDTLQFEFPRKRRPDGSIIRGLGIELFELAGGRSDGVGITVVSGLVPDGNAQGSGLLPGDSIIKVALVKKISAYNTDSSMMPTSSAWEERHEIRAVATECLGYDLTIEAIQSLLSLSPTESDHGDDESYFAVTVKRLRQRPKVTVKLQYPPQQNEADLTLELFAGENLRRAMLLRGVRLNDPLAQRFDSGWTAADAGDCGAEGMCTTCAVSVLRGAELLNRAGPTETNMMLQQNTPRWRLACKAIVGHGMKQGELVVRVNPRQW